MKTKFYFKYFIVLFFVSTLIGCSFNGGLPEIDIYAKSNLPGLAGDTIEYSIKLNSKTPLQNFSIEPSIKGGNDKSVYSTKFQKNAYQAEIKYLYVIPASYKESNVISLTFKIESESGSNVYYSAIPVYNPPQFVTNGLVGKDVYTQKIISSTKGQLACNFVESAVNRNSNDNASNKYEGFDKLYSQLSVSYLNYLSQDIQPRKTSTFKNYAAAYKSTLRENKTEKDEYSFPVYSKSKNDDGSMFVAYSPLKSKEQNPQLDYVSRDITKTVAASNIPNHITKVQKIKTPKKLKYSYGAKTDEITLAYSFESRERDDELLTYIY